MKRFSRNLPAVGAVVALVASALAPLPALAWGAEGHRMIAAEAQQLLTPAARVQVDKLLALEPGATLVSISTWADETRSRATASWHYVNFPRDADCVYVAPRDCKDGDCVVDAIQQQEAVLSSSASDAEKLVALKYLVHFVGDVHQPLHAGYFDDKGGNTFQVRFEGKGTSLHSVWDSGLIRAWPGGQEALWTAVSAKADALRDADTSTPSQWAEESCRIVATPRFYPSSRGIDAAYEERMDPVLVDRLAAAASRLAGLINEAFGSAAARTPPGAL